jgi:2-polyprenyl-3-methyl-5-hydroxy-6-metoxy-1,4-benzoquinol methylase
MAHLTTGNSAKLYCVNWIENYIQEHGESIRILDMGSGTSKDFIALLQRYPDVQYIGIEPFAAACELARKNLQGENVKIVNDSAYDMMGRIVHQPFDILVSFSVMEHVVQRQRHLTSAANCMHENSHFLINYDAGHFVFPNGFKERAKTIIGPLLALFGIERYYQRFVKENDFQQMASTAGLTVSEVKSFNTMMKGIHKIVPEAHQEEHLERWLDYELWLNEIGTAYADKYAKYWVTRNFILQKK